MPCKSRLLVKDDVFNMTCDKLRKECKKKRLSHVGKKSELQFRLVEYLQNQEQCITEDGEEDPPQINDEEPMETDEPGQEESANRTFTIEDENKEDQKAFLHDGTPTNAVGLVLDQDAKRDLCTELGIDLHNFEVKSRTRVHRVSSRKSLRAADVDVPSQESPEKEEENRGVTPSRQRPPSRVVDRFAMIHAKEMEKMESLGDHRDRVQKRHEDLTSNVPDSIKRLATPKSLKKRAPLDKAATPSSSSTGWKPQNPAQMTFKFGDNNVNSFADVVNARKETGESTSTAVTPKKSASRARARVDVKKLTKIPRPSRGAVTPRAVKSVSRTVDSTFVDYMSTPKGATPNRAPRRGGYTPFAGKKVFVDTTQLTDREYKLAAEEGLIPGKTATKTNLELRQLESKKRRDDIIALKRKMNIG
uniref:SAP domain-containing protein n=1 Tax=Caenorhabditis japonica TaxID=281687 RepID=A0A8R1HVR7_CAEJA